MQNFKVKIGLVGVMHGNMPGDSKNVYKDIIAAMEVLSSKLDFDLISVNEPLLSEKDGETAREFLDGNGVDFTIVVHASLGGGRTILPLAKVKSFLGIWAIPEPVQSGILQLNSICGLNMYSSIIGNYLKDYDIPFKWFFGMPDSAMFLERLRLTLDAMKAIKALKNSRVGLVGDIADGFENLNFDERIPGKKFGTSIYRRHTVEDIVRRAESYDESCVDKTLDKINSEGIWLKDKVSMESMQRLARVYLAFEDFAGEFQYDALAVSCWPKFQQIYDVAICAALSRLNENGIVASCEGDVPGVLNMIMLNALTGGKSTISDLVSIDEEDASICMWHCGPTPGSFAGKNGIRWDSHFNIGCYCDGKWCGKGVVTDLTFKPGKVTISRINSGFDRMLVMNGEVMDGKKCFGGSGGWINNLEMDSCRLSIKDCINTLIYNRLDHHYEIAYGNVADALYEIAGWMKMEIMPVVPYRPYFQRPNN